MAGKGVDRLGADPVQADRFLESLGVVFGAGVHLRHTFHYLSQGYAPAVVADGGHVIPERDFDGLPVPHHELVNRVVDYFLEQHIDTVVLAGAVA